MAGLRIAVEVPEELPWCAPGAHQRDADGCLPVDPDVYVSVGVGRVHGDLGDGIHYESAGQHFEVARDGEDWLVAVRRRRGPTRLARFDARFEVGEVIVDRDHAADLVAAGRSPLAHPVDELLVLHRLLREGGLLIRARRVVCEGRGLLFAGGDSGPASVAVRLTETGALAYRLPRAGQADGPRAVELDGIHLLEEAPAIYSEPLEGEEARDALLERAFAPVHDPTGVLALGSIGDALVERLPVWRLGLPRESRVVPFTWGQREAALAFSRPLAG